RRRHTRYWRDWSSDVCLPICFIQEARASSQIASPHIPRYFDFGTTADGLPYAIMEYFEGETLGVRLGRVGTLSVADTAQVVEQVASALLMAHGAGLIH